MKLRLLLVVFVFSLLLTGCGSMTPQNNANSQAGEPMALTDVARPKKIVDQMAERGEQDAASPTLKIIEPKEGSTINSAIVKVKLEVSGDLKGYKPHMDPETKMGNHIHVILDNQPYEAYYNLDQEFELRNVADGEHVIRVFPSRPWHESYKNEGAFQMVRFTVKSGGGDPSKPTTTADGKTMANANTAATPEGKDMKMSVAGPVDPARPLLTYSRPKGEYRGEDTGAIMIDFWLSNAKLVGDGGEYRVRFRVGQGESRFFDKWEPIWLAGWTSGSHIVELELVDRNGQPVDNGGFNTTIRDIMVFK